MQINAFSAPTAPSSTHAAAAASSPSPQVSPSFAHFLSRQNEQAVKPQGDSPAAATSAANTSAATPAASWNKAAAKAPAPAAAPQPKVHKTEGTSAKDKPTDADRTDSAPAAGDAAAAPTAADASSTSTETPLPAPAADGLNPWLALMQQLAATQPTAPATTVAGGALPAADGAAAAAARGDAAVALPSLATGAQGASAAPAATPAATPAAATPASDAATLATRLAAKPEGGAGHFGNALAASLAAQPDSSAIGSEWRARERDAASTALPTATASATNFASLLASAPTPSQTSATASAAAAGANIVNLPVPVGSPEFAPSLAATVSVLAREGVQEARINLHPAEMGPITVQITVDGAQARVDFSADMAATRSALEAGLPELASALRDAGLTLSGGGVFDQSQSGRPGAGSQAEGGRHSRNTARDSDGPNAVAAAQPAARRVALDGLDEYA